MPPHSCLISKRINDGIAARTVGRWHFSNYLEYGGCLDFCARTVPVTWLTAPADRATESVPVGRVIGRVAIFAFKLSQIIFLCIFMVF